MDDPKISANDLPEAIRSEDPGSGPVVLSSPRPRLKRQLSSFFTTGLSLLAVTGLVLSAGREIQAPIESPAPFVDQVLGVSETQAPEVAEIEGPASRPGGTRTRWVKPQRSNTQTRHVTLSFGGSGSNGGGSRAPEPGSSWGSDTPSNTKPREQKRPEKVKEVEAELAVATTELIHIHKIGTGEHFYSIDRAECERRYQDGYIYKGVIGLVFDRQVEGTVPLRTDDGIAAYIWRDAGSDRWPVHYFRGPGSEQKRDYFTTSEMDRQDYVARGWTYLGVVGYVSAR